MTAFPKPKDAPRKRKRKMSYAKRKTRNRRAMIRELDAAARTLVFDRDGYRCVRCGKDRNLQWAHIFSRRCLATRWQSANALTLCAGCHLWWHEHLALSVPWFMENWPERYEWMRREFNAGGKVDIAELHAELQGGE